MFDYTISYISFINCYETDRWFAIKSVYLFHCGLNNRVHDLIPGDPIRRVNQLPMDLLWGNAISVIRRIFPEMGISAFRFLGNTTFHLQLQP